MAWFVFLCLQSQSRGLKPCRFCMCKSFPKLCPCEFGHFIGLGMLVLVKTLQAKESPAWVSLEWAPDKASPTTQNLHVPSETTCPCPVSLREFPEIVNQPCEHFPLSEVRKSFRATPRYGRAKQETTLKLLWPLPCVVTSPKGSPFITSKSPAHDKRRFKPPLSQQAKAN